ncbi:MAG: hypothetical protein JXB05_23700 [Myxococcaceae bacterium]|nr:hypothetical protein [Myxococcaceae bacterium]
MHVSRKTVWGHSGGLLALALTLVLTPGCPDNNCEGELANTPECDGGGGGGGGGGSGPGTVSGKATYDFVPAVYDPSTRAGTLQFNATVKKSIRNAVVQVRQGTTILATGATDEQGSYQLSFTANGSGTLSLVVLAKTTSPAIQVQDNTDGDAVWAISGGITTGTTTKDLHASHGWTGSSFNATQRTAAPFAVLDSMYTAAKAFQAVRPVTFPDLKVNWSPNNVPQGGNKANGFIGTSHYTSQEKEIYILGKEGADTDEFDSHVIVHEWGHYFEDGLSRSDSPGGPHGRGDVLDPRLAFGEGYGNALAAMVLPESVYTDTSWSGGQIAAFGFDAELEPGTTDDPSPGAFSEMTVLRVLYDLFDSTNEGLNDQIAVGLGTVYDVLVGPQKTTEAMTTIGSFIAGLKAQQGVNASAVDTLLANHNIGPISSAYGDGDDGATGLRAIYTQVNTLPFSGTISLGGGFDYNKWEQNQYYVFTGTGGTMTLTASNADHDVGIAAYRQGQMVGSADKLLKGTETFTFSSQADTKYILVLTGFKETPGDYPISISITSP